MFPWNPQCISPLKVQELPGDNANAQARFWGFEGRSIRTAESNRTHLAADLLTLRWAWKHRRPGAHLVLQTLLSARQHAHEALQRAQELLAEAGGVRTAPELAPAVAGGPERGKEDVRQQAAQAVEQAPVRGVQHVEAHLLEDNQATFTAETTFNHSAAKPSLMLFLSQPPRGRK